MKMYSRCERPRVLVKAEKKRRREKTLAEKEEEEIREGGSSQREGRALTLAVLVRSGGVRVNQSDG